MRLNSQLPLRVRRELDERHFNSVKFMKLIESRWLYERPSMRYVADTLDMSIDDVRTIFRVWNIYLRGMFNSRDCRGLSKKENYKRRFAEMNMSRRVVMRIRDNSDYSDRDIVKFFGVPARQGRNMRIYLDLPEQSRKEYYRRKMAAEYRNNEVRYGKGVKNSFQIPAAKKKIKETNLKRYGNTCARNNPIVRQKQIDTLKRRYGEGVVNPFQIESVKQVIRQKQLGISVREAEKELYWTKKSRDKDYMMKLLKFAYFKNGNKSVALISLPDYFPHIRYMRFYEFWKKYPKETSKYVRNSSSSFSQLERDFIKQVLNRYKLKYDLHPHLFKVFSRYHVDFYLPDFKLAIELNPAFTHQKYDGYRERFSPRSRNWKFNMLKRQGVILLNLYSPDFESSFDGAIKKLKYAIDQIKQGKHLMCDNVPFCVKQTVHERQRGLYCFNEGLTWWVD